MRPSRSLRASKASIFLAAAWAPLWRSSQHATHCRRHIVGRDKILDRSLVERIRDAALLRQPHLQPPKLVDAGDGAAGQLGELGIEFWGRLRDRTSCSGQFAVDVKAAGIDAQVEQPQLLLFRR
jgi:hypothetical protein